MIVFFIELFSNLIVEEIPVDVQPSQASLHSTFNAEPSDSANQESTHNKDNQSNTEVTVEATNQMQIDATSAVQSASTMPAESTNQMQVDVPGATDSCKNGQKDKTKPKKTGLQAKASIPDRRRTLPAASGSKPTRISKPRESLLPPPKNSELL